MSSSAGVLLATDLSMRCDRATDRAIGLARAFGGPALAATVIEPAERLAQQVPRHDLPDWYRVPDPLHEAERMLRGELDDAGAGWDVRVGEGRAGEWLSTLLSTAAGGEPLLVTGPVRGGVLGPVVLGSTVDVLLRRAGTALLMVRRRARADYRHVLVASDFSSASGYALQRVRKLFPQARITLLHGVQVPMLGLMDTSQDAAIAQAGRQAQQEGRDFLRAADGEGIGLLVAHGDPARLAQQYVETFRPDLVAVGTHGRGAMYQLVLGSVARRIATGVDADTLIVHAAHA